MKKLTVLVMIPALAVLMAAMASADGRKHWGGIHGDYAMTATGTCLNSWKGAIVDSSMPDDVWGASNMVQGIWTFERDGTGKASGKNYPMIPPPVDILNPPAFPRVGVGRGEFWFDFTYEVTRDGAITFWITPGTFLGKNLLNGVTFTSDNCGADKCELFGLVSSDHKTMTLASTNPTAYTYPNGATQYTICNITRVFFRMTDQDDD